MRSLGINTLLVFLILLFQNCTPNSSTGEQTNSHVENSTAPREVWSKEKANDWYAAQGWLVGANYNPRTSINQLEMWQAATFDTATINQELGWAADMGMNTMRVYLHDLLWQQDSTGFF